uniref:mitochondrial fission 1 protein-like n=1 Tax=Myxine glutinosa TaxID=7769 RepID=UPI00358ED694
MEEIIRDSIAPDDLMKFEKKFNGEMARGPVSQETQFEYAWCLVRSKYAMDIRRGVLLLEELLPGSPEDERRDYLFYIGIGSYRLKEYEKSLKCMKTLLKNEPTNKQALDLQRLVKKTMEKDALLGMAIVGGVVVGLASVVAYAVHKVRS